MEPTIETLEPRRCIGRRARVRITEIGDRVGELLPAVMGAAGDACAGPPFARWHDWDEAAGSWMMELGVPVSREVDCPGDVEADELPGGRAVVHWHVGPYDRLAASWDMVRAWVGAQELTARGAPWEEYWGDCSQTPAEELRTRIVWPIE